RLQVLPVRAHPLLLVTLAAAERHGQSRIAVLIEAEGVKLTLADGDLPGIRLDDGPAETARFATGLGKDNLLAFLALQVQVLHAEQVPVTQEGERNPRTTDRALVLPALPRSDLGQLADLVSCDGLRRQLPFLGEVFHHWGGHYRCAQAWRRRRLAVDLRVRPVELLFLDAEVSLDLNERLPVAAMAPHGPPEVKEVAGLACGEVGPDTGFGACNTNLERFPCLATYASSFPLPARGPPCRQ